MQTRSSSSSPSTDLIPLRVGHSRESKLQIVGPTLFHEKLLPGWTVVNRPRSPSSSSNGRVDTYFIDPGTGRQFPFLESVQKYLTREVDDKRLTRAGVFFQDNTRVYEGSRTKEDHRRFECSSKGFRLPKGWTVEEFMRKSSHHIDKYYVEQKTGKRFRSLISVERYLKESKNRADQQLMLLPYRRGPSKDFSLPDGWIVEEKPRRNSSQIDRSYVEPGTGNKFRSLAAVERYLQAVGNGTVDSVSMGHSERLSLVMNRNDTGFKTEVIDPNPPEKVKWVLTGPGGNMFSASMRGSDVSSSVKQTWTEAFVSVIQDR